MSIKSLFEDIADAIREKSGSSDTYTPAEMPEAIRNISGGGDFVENEYSEYLNNILNLGITIDTTHIIECAFYANAYQNDGHIIGNMTQSAGNGFHLTTYSNRWYGSNGSSEFNFAAASDYPLYGADIVYRLEGNNVYMNGTQVASSNRGTLGTTYALNTRGGSVSTQGKYRYKYFKIWNSNNELIHHFVFGSILDGSLKVCKDLVTGTFIFYN